MTNEELAALLTKLDGEATPGPVKVVLIGYQPEPRLVDSTEKLLAIFGNAEDPREVFDEWNGNVDALAVGAFKNASNCSPPSGTRCGKQPASDLN